MTKNDLLNTITHLGHKPVTFEPTPIDDDDDELTRAINDPIYHDNHWDLHEAVDTEALEKFWDAAADDLSTEAEPES